MLTNWNINNSAYWVDMRDFEFLLWELYAIDKSLLMLPQYSNNTKDDINKILTLAKNFAVYELGTIYSSTDQAGCKLLTDGTVQVPAEFSYLWPKFKQDWGSFIASSTIPKIVKRMVSEMFLGANPAFFTYSGFAHLTAEIIQLYGTKTQHQYIPFLQDLNWTACFCVTEPQAGSDISAIQTTARKISAEIYELEGEKIFITAGMHSLSANTLYLVIAKTNDYDSTYGLSCFIVPKYLLNADLSLGARNGVECIRLFDKMGFNACATVHLKFGQKQKCYAYLLGEKENIALMQISHIMNEARIGTGLFALGLSSAAYLYSANYAAKRIQGRALGNSYNFSAPRQEIIKHADVKRMLLTMKSKVEAFRAFIAKLAYFEAVLENYQFNPQAAPAGMLTEYATLIDIFNPLIKAYFADEAWNITTLAIQVCGGNGYLQDLPLEQYARDVKILSIWEGTNYIQAQTLLRDKLGYASYPAKLNLILNFTQTQIGQLKQHQLLRDEINLVQKTLLNLASFLKQLFKLLTIKDWDNLGAYSSICLKICAESLISIIELEVLDSCLAALNKKDISPADSAFYNEKIAAARLFLWDNLPHHPTYLEILSNAKIDYKLDLRFKYLKKAPLC